MTIWTSPPFSGGAKRRGNRGGEITLAFCGRFTVFIEILASFPQLAENPTAGLSHLRKRRGSVVMTTGAQASIPEAAAASAIPRRKLKETLETDVPK
jgi:hypothetical protein